MALATHPVGAYAARIGEFDHRRPVAALENCAQSSSSSSGHDMSFSNSVSARSFHKSHLHQRIASSLSSSLCAAAACYSKTVRSASVSLKDSEAPPSQANDERRTFVSSPNFQTDKTPSGGRRNPSIAEQLRVASGEGDSTGIEAPIRVSPRRDRPVRFTVDRWAPQGSKFNRAADVSMKLKHAEATEEDVERVLENWEDPLTSREICAVISGLKWRKALAFFRWTRKQGFEVNTVVYNVLLGTMRTAREWQAAEEFALEMVSEGVQLDNYTYSTLISCALQCRAPSDALAWFDRMHAAGIVPDEVTCSTMTLVYSRLGRFDEAVQLYESLRSTGWKPDKVTYGSMINVYSRAGKYQKASALIKEMKEQGLKPDALIYNTLIKFFAREGKTGQAKRVFKEMETAGVKASEYTLSLMIDVHGRSGNADEAFALFSRMKEENLPLDTAVYNSLLKMCGEERLVEEGESLVSEMIERGLQPDEITYKSLVNLYAKEGRIDDAVKAMQQMAQAGCPPDVVVFSCLIKSCGITKQFVRAEEFFNEMLASGATVDDRCCGVLLSLVNLCETDEDRSAVLRCLERAKPILHRVVKLLLSEEVDKDLPEQLVRQLLDESVTDSHRPFCNSLIDFCWNLGYKERAESLLSLADSLKVYPGTLRTHTNLLWVLHLRSLSFNTADCALSIWIQFLRRQIGEGHELPETLVIETGAGRNRGRDDGLRLITVILAKLKEMGAPFETSSERSDWLVATGPSVTSWLQSQVEEEQVETSEVGSS